MKRPFYFNEIDPKAAAWIQQLIDDKQIPNGHVDSRSILDVTPADLAGYTQCHFFAGVAGWSLALRLAGWPDTEPIWTASLPCQPWSTAGKQNGSDDERHLAPTFLALVRACNPPRIVGEQVSSKLARTQWLPGIRVEFEALGYTFVPVDLCSPCAGEIGEGRIVRGDSESWERVILGKPHIRQRLYWVADSRCQYDERRGAVGDLHSEAEGAESEARKRERRGDANCDSSAANGLGHAESQRRNACGDDDNAAERTPCETGAGGVTDRDIRFWDTYNRMADTPSGGQRIDGGASRGTGHADERGEADSDAGLADTGSGGREVEMQQYGDGGEAGGVGEAGFAGSAGAPNGIPHSSTGLEGRGRPGEQPLPQGWQGEVGHATESSEYVLLPCRDGKTRRTQRSIQPLVNGIPRGVVPSGNPNDPSYANATAEARATRLKGCGNAIQIDTAVLFIKSYQEAVNA